MSPWHVILQIILQHVYHRVKQFYVLVAIFVQIVFFITRGSTELLFITVKYLVDGMSYCIFLFNKSTPYLSSSLKKVRVFDDVILDSCTTHCLLANIYGIIV